MKGTKKMTTANFSLIKTRNADVTVLTIAKNGVPISTVSTNPIFQKILDAARKSDYELAYSLSDEAQRISDYTEGTFKVVDGDMIVAGRIVPMDLADMILDFDSQGLDYKPLVKFAYKLMQNPSMVSIRELFMFLSKNKQPITEDGDFLAYKRVGDDFKDLYSHTFDNSVGKVVKMPRAQVDDDRTRTCSNGLHVANWHYAQFDYCAGQGVVLAVKVNPADVVSVPPDYNESKMRVCGYEVLYVVKDELKEKLLSEHGVAIPAPELDNGCEDEEDDENEEFAEDDYCEDCEHCIENCTCFDGEDEDDELDEDEIEDKCTDPECMTCHPETACKQIAPIPLVAEPCDFCGMTYEQGCRCEF